MSEHGFEGTEKKLLVRFAANSSFPSGLRTYSAQDWQKMLDQARCTIISSTSNDRFDSYVLSESSLFVYPTMIVVKTCGTTVPLNVIPILLDYSTQLNLVVELVFYCRKNFKFPQHQPAPHTSFSEEVELLQEYFDCGSAHVLGPITDEHWNLFLADYTPRFQHYKGDNLQVLEIMMLDLDRSVMKNFYKDQNPSFVSAKQTTLTSGIADILPGSVTDERQFDPCGYSVNGLLDETYFTIHVTPEPHCSFVSFETNAPVKDYTEIIRKVIDVFKPSKFSVSVLYGSHSPIASVPRPFDEKLFGFTVNYSSSSHFAGYGAKFFNYVDEGNLVRSLEVKKRVSFPLLPRLYVPQIPELPVASVSC